jgi:hypothetical protein
MSWCGSQTPRWARGRMITCIRSIAPGLKADIVERFRVGDRPIGHEAKNFELTQTAASAG